MSSMMFIFSIIIVYIIVIWEMNAIEYYLGFFN